jgi:WD40 repeat protein
MFRPIMATEEKQLATITQTGPVGDVPLRGPTPNAVALKERDHRRYEFVEEHGRGGLGRVMRTRDTDLGREVAVKEILEQGGIGEERFVREAMITARLEHPGIVPVYDAGRWPNGTPFYSMKLVSGKPLKELIRAAKTVEERLGLLPHVIAVADALAYAHDRGIIHRDLKPSNIIVGQFGETVVIDWGLAKDIKLADRAPELGPYRTSDDSGVTVAGAVLGTPAYMPPEQARGAEVDQRADVYAIGSILYHLVAGKPPYDGPSEEIVRALGTRAPEPLQTVAPRTPTELTAIIARAMHRDPDHRYRTAIDLADDLRRFQNGQLVAAYSYSAADLARRWVRKHRLLVAGVTALLAGLICAAYVTVTRVLAARAQVAERETRLATANDALTRRTDSLQLTELQRQLLEDPTGVVHTVAGLLSGNALARVDVVPLLRKADLLGVADWQQSIDGSASLSLTSTGEVAVVDSHSVRILDASTGHVISSAAFSGRASVWHSAWITPERLAIVRADGSIWRAGRGGELSQVLKPPVSQRALPAIRAGELHAATVGTTGIEILNLVTAQVDRSVTTVGTPRILALDGDTFAALDDDGMLVVSGSSQDFRCKQPGSWKWSNIELDQAQGIVALADDLGHVVIFSYRTCHEKASLERTESRTVFLKIIPGSPSKLLVAGNDNTITIADIDGRRPKILQGWLLAYNESSSWLALGDMAGNLVLQDVPTGWSRTLKAHAAFVLDVLFDRAGRVYTASSDGSVRAWSSLLAPAAVIDTGDNVRALRSNGCSRAYAVLKGGRLIELGSDKKASDHQSTLDLVCIGGRETPITALLPSGNDEVIEILPGEGGWFAATRSKAYWLKQGSSAWVSWNAALGEGEQLGRIATSPDGVLIATSKGRVLAWHPATDEVTVVELGPPTVLVNRIVAWGTSFAGLLSSGDVVVMSAGKLQTIVKSCAHGLASTERAGGQLIVACGRVVRVFARTTLREVAVFSADEDIARLWSYGDWALLATGDNLTILDLKTGAARALPVRIAVQDAAVRENDDEVTVYIAGYRSVQIWRSRRVDMLNNDNVKRWVTHHSP